MADIFKTKITKELRLKSDKIIPIGANVTVVHLNDSYCGVTFIGLDGIEIKTRIPYVQAFKYLNDFKQPPSIQSLQKKYETDANCKNPIGNIVEIDGTDHYGFPSWCRIILGI